MSQERTSMWLENLKEMKAKSGLSPKQIAEKTQLPERTIKRIFAGETDNPYVDTIHRIADAIGCTLNDIFADTKVVVATETLAEVKEVAEVVSAEKELLLAELEMLRTKTAAQEMEITLLKKDLQHKDELLAVYNYFTKIKPME